MANEETEEELSYTKQRKRGQVLILLALSCPSFSFTDLCVTQGLWVERRQAASTVSPAERQSALQSCVLEMGCDDPWLSGDGAAVSCKASANQSSWPGGRGTFRARVSGPHVDILRERRTELGDSETPAIKVPLVIEML